MTNTGAVQKDTRVTTLTHLIPRFLWVALLLALTVRSAPLAAQEAESNVFGVVEGFWLPEEVCDMGAGWERIIFSWAQHQPTGPEDWHTLNVDDRWLEAARACDREVVAVVKDTPQWATDGLAGAGVPRGLDLPLDDPGNVWATFMRRAAAYYAERGVRRFVIWNEPDITRDTYGYEFEGSLEDYAQLLKVAALAAREGNPDALIHVAGTTYWHDVNEGRRLYLDRLLELLTADPDAEANGTYFDAVTLHIYFRTETVYQIIDETRELLERYGLADKSIWLDETNASPNLDPQWPVTRPRWQITLDQQAAFLVQAAGLGLAAGADHIGVYKFFDWTLAPGEEAFGLVRVDGSRRPAFDAWTMVIAQLNGVTSAQAAQTPRLMAVRLERDDGQSLLMAWSRGPQAAVLRASATGSQSHLLDQYGKMMTLRPTEGRYTLTLPGALCHPVDGCPVGGYVSLLVQPSGQMTVEELTTEGPLPLTFE
jgi:hypothetical protein